MATQQTLTIRHATEADLPIIMELVKSAIKIMHDSGNTGQWKDGYPGKDVIMADITSDTCYLLLAGDKPVGSFALKPGPDPTYSEIYDGAWLNDKPYATIHRIASSGEVKGVFSLALRFALQRYDSIRIDTHADNKVMQSAIAKAGFSYCGIIHCWNGSERLAYQFNKG